MTRSVAALASTASLSAGQQGVEKNELSKRLATLIAAEHLKGFASSYEEPHSVVLDVWWHGPVTSSIRQLAQHAAPAVLSIESAPYSQLQLSGVQTLLIKRFGRPTDWAGWIIGSVTEPVDASGLDATIFRPDGGSTSKPSPYLLAYITAEIRNAAAPIAVLSVTVHALPFAA